MPTGLQKPVDSIRPTLVIRRLEAAWVVRDNLLNFQLIYLSAFSRSGLSTTSCASDCWQGGTHTTQQGSA